MSYKPPRVKSSWERIRGAATVQLHKTGKAKVTFKDSGITHIIAAENVEADPVWAGRGFVEVSEDGSRFFSMRPWKGLFPAICLGIATGSNDEPVPDVRDGKWGEYLTFNALIQIAEGKYKGATYATMFHYKFQDADGVAALPGERGKSPNTDKLEDFMFITGAWQEALEFSSNLLPEIDRRIVNAEQKFMIAVKDGYVDQMIEIESDDEEPVTDW